MYTVCAGRERGAVVTVFWSFLSAFVFSFWLVGWLERPLALAGFTMAATIVTTMMRKKMHEQELNQQAGAPTHALASLKPEAGDAADEGPQSLPEKMLDIINSTSLQTVLYIAFVLIFQMLTETIRSSNEFYRTPPAFFWI